MDLSIGPLADRSSTLIDDVELRSLDRSQYSKVPRQLPARTRRNAVGVRASPETTTSVTAVSVCTSTDTWPPLWMPIGLSVASLSHVSFDTEPLATSPMSSSVAGLTELAAGRLLGLRI